MDDLFPRGISELGDDRLVKTKEIEGIARGRVEVAPSSTRVSGKNCIVKSKKISRKRIIVYTFTANVCCKIHDSRYLCRKIAKFSADVS